MKIELMRKIDRRLGRPITYLFSLFVKSRDMLPGEDVHSIVVSKYFGIGSIALSTPLLQSLRERFPKATILFVTFQQNAELLKLFPFIDEVITIRNDTMFDFIVDTLKTISRFRNKSGIDLFVDMEFFSYYSSLMAWLSGSRFRVGFHTSLLNRGRLLTHRVAFNPHRYITEAFCALGQKIGAGKEYTLYRPNINDTYIRRVSEWMKHRELRKNEYVIVNTHGSDHLGSLKQWPPEKCTHLITKIVESLKLPVILTGVKKDRADIEKIINLLPSHVSKSVFNTAGDFSLGEFLALLGISRFLITIDSGPLHLSQFFGVPCVVLFGPETPVLYGPRREYARTIYMDLYCSPCCNVLEGKKAECTNPFYNQCMRGIEVEKVWHEVIDLNKYLGERVNEFKPLSGLREERRISENIRD
ncbi:MAG: glycosyltransferase family 9 protein [Thermodesulfovibrionales bacterium]